MLKLMWINGMPMWIPVTEQEDAERVAMLEAVRNIPEIKPYAQSYCGYCADERDAMPGRHAKAEFSPETGGYDYLYAELCNERNAEKARVRNRRRADRKHKLTPKMRKEQEWMRNMHICNRYIGWGWDLLDNAKAESAEKIARADWELEQDEIAEAEEWERAYAELEEFDRKWREEAEAEQRRMREYRKLRDLHEWLKYA